jgi:hypothetical protein
MATTRPVGSRSAKIGAPYLTIQHSHSFASDAIARDRLADHFAGTFRCNSSKKFNKKNTWFCDCRASDVSAGVIATMRLPSAARS